VHYDEQHPKAGRNQKYRLTLLDSVTRQVIADEWSEPLRVDKKLSNADSWREVHEEDQAALRPGLQDISISRT
jgi:hypothetical protein